jgi:GPH family glycoside/pentoside/hexuronide:cation symporter/glucuronide carrier protein
MEALKESKQKKDSVLGFLEKVSFFLANAGNIPVMILLSSYLLLFYTDVVGLNPVAIGTLFLIARVLDGVSDPINGYIIDHLPRTKWGRFRPYLFIGAVVTALNFLLVWLGPALATSGKLIVAYISYILIGWTFDYMDIPLNSMIPVMSDRDRDRNTLSVIKYVGYLLAGAVFAGLALPIISTFPTKREGFFVLIIAATVFIALFSILGTLGIKERIFPVKAEKYKFRDLKDIIGARPVLVFFLETLAYGISQGVNGGIGVFFFLYALKRPDLYPLMALSMVVGMIVAVAIGPMLIKRFGKKNMQTWSMVITILGTAIMFFTPAGLPIVFILVPLIISPATAVIGILMYSIQADNMDYVEWKLGYRSEAAVASVSSFVAKASVGIGSAVSAFLLPVIHYVPNAETQAAETVRGFFALNYAIPGTFMLIGLLIWAFGYPLTKKVREQMMAELIERRKLAAGEKPAVNPT